MKVNPTLCAGLPASSTCIQNTTTGSANMALEQNQQAAWSYRLLIGIINMHELTRNIMDCEMYL
jgi:hypothetical protein